MTKGDDDFPDDTLYRRARLEATLPSFHYKREQQRQIISEAVRRGLCRGTKPRDVIAWTTTAARFALRTKRRDTEVRALENLVREAKAFRDRIDSSPAASSSVDEELADRFERVEVGSPDEAILNKLGGGVLDLERFRLFLDVVQEAAVRVARHHVGGRGTKHVTIPRRGPPRNKARFNFGLDLYVIFEKATGKKPTRRFVEAAMRPTGILNADKVDRLVQEVVAWVRESSPDPIIQRRLDLRRNVVLSAIRAVLGIDS
jgi:hypothetical protein